jgi:hypothetical protein
MPIAQVTFVHGLCLHGSKRGKIDDSYSRDVSAEIVFGFALICFGADLRWLCLERHHSAITASLDGILRRSYVSEWKPTARIELKVLREEARSRSYQQNDDAKAESIPMKHEGGHVASL